MKKESLPLSWSNSLFKQLNRLGGLLQHTVRTYTLSCSSCDVRGYEHTADQILILEPTDSNQQVYPFKAIKDGQYYYPENDGSDLVKGDGRNCLLFAEKVQKRPMPGNVWVTWSGNFAPDDTTKDGTFLLNHEIFIQQYLLPAFQQLNKASEILHKKNQTFWQDNNDMVRYSTPYTVGKNSDHPKPEDVFYSFKPEYAAGSTYKVLKYTWTSENGPFTSDVQTFRTCKTKGTVHGKQSGFTILFRKPSD